MANQSVARPRHTSHVAPGEVGVVIALLGSLSVLGSWFHGPMVRAVALEALVLAAAALVAGLFAREIARQQLLDRFAGAVRELGRREPQKVRVNAWQWPLLGWTGRPGKIQVRYRWGTFDLADPALVPQMVRAARTTFGGGTYRATVNTIRGRITFTLDTAPASTTVETPEVRRARGIVEDLIGPTTVIEGITTTDDGDVASLEVRHAAGTRLVASGYRTRVESTLSQMLPGRWRAQWDMQNDRVRFELRPSLPDSILVKPLGPVDQNPLTNYDQVAVPIGVDEDGELIVWRPAVNPHLLIAGAAGSGKTSLMHAILARFTEYGWPAWIVDGKAIEFLGFRQWPNVQLVATGIEEQVAAIHRAWALMEHRYRLVTSGLARTEDFEPLVLVLDEFADFRGTLMSWYAGIKIKGDAAKPLTLAEAASLARKSRTARIHLVFATQRPDAEFLSGEMRDNFSMRVSVGRLSLQGAQMMWEDPTVGVTLPRGKRGRAVAVNAAGNPVELQCFRMPDPKQPWPEDSEEAELLAAVRPPEAHHPRLVIDLPVETLDSSGDEPMVVKPVFADYQDAPWALASDRPDLDPLHRAPDDAFDGRDLGSTLGVLGLLPGQNADRSRPRLRLVPENPVSSAPVTDDYGPETWTSPADVAIGDLVEVGDGRWAVVEETPLDDLDTSNVAINWRDDDDERGVLLIPADDTVSTRPANGRN